jgi:hypothetical protein
MDPGTRQTLGIADAVKPISRRTMFDRVVSQTSPQERVTLYALARRYYRGAGAIFDLGTSTGGTATCLALGLRDKGMRRVVHTFDIFGGHATKIFGRKSTGLNFTNDLDVVEHTTRPVADYVRIHSTDLTNPFLHLTGEQEVEIAHIDAAKSQTLWSSIVAELAGAVIPKRTIWILQDFGQMRLPFVLYGLEYIRQCGDGDYVGGSAPAAAMCFRFVNKPPADAARKITADDFTLDEKLSLVDLAFANIKEKYAHLYGHQDMESHRIATRAFCYLHANQPKKCLELLLTADPEFRKTERWRRARRQVREFVRSQEIDE